MNTVRWIISTAPEIFLLLAVAIGTIFGRVKIRGFAIGTTACTLIVAVLIGQLGTFTFPPVLRVVLFSLFVFTIGYRSGPEFFASLSVRTLAQVAMALVLGGSGLATGALTQSSVIDTASGALAQLGLSKNVLDQQEANIAAGYAITYVLGYILTLLFVPFVAPKLMRIDLKKEAAKLEAELSGGAPPKTENLAYRKFQARAYRVSAGAGRTVKTIEDEVGSRTVIERIVRKGADIQPHLDTILEVGDDIVIAGPTAAIVAAKPVIGTEIDADEILRAIPGNVVEVLVDSRKLHGRSIREVVERVGDNARGVFLRALTRMGREVPLSPDTRIYVGDVMTLVGSTRNIERTAAQVGQILRSGDRTDIAFLAAGIATGPARRSLEREGRLRCADARRRRRGADRGSRLRMATLASADHGRNATRRTADAQRPWTWRVHRGCRACQRPRCVGRDPGARLAAGRHGPCRHAGSADRRNAVCLPRTSHEPGHHLRCARRRHDDRRRRDRMLRDCREPDAGARRRRALRRRQRCSDRARADHRCLHIYWLIEGVVTCVTRAYVAWSLRYSCFSPS
jgi:putative transport protein